MGNIEHTWSKKPVQVGNQLSVVFTWHLPEAIDFATRCELLLGGPAVKLLPALVPDGLLAPDEGNPWLNYHNPFATRTSVGCIRQCAFCVVKQIEPQFKELATFEPRPILIDNNFLACSKSHILHVVDQLSYLRGIDFNQGLDARLLQEWHIDAFKRLHWFALRLAWDSAAQETSVIDAVARLRRAGFPKSKLHCYVLIGFVETEDEAMYRCQTLKSLGVSVNPMRYQPKDALTKDAYCPPQWNPVRLKRFMRYWARQNWFSRVPYQEFLDSYKSAC